MGVIDIRRFAGLNDNTSSTDTALIQADVIKDFEIAKKTGKLRKRTGLLDNFSSYPAGWVIISIDKIEVNKPSTQTLFLVHAQVSGIDRIYIRPFLDLDGVTFTDDWLELTESEENLTLGAVTATTVEFTSPTPNTNDDFYNSWILCNFTLGKQEFISDYSESGGTGTLTLGYTGENGVKTSGIVGQTANDVISIYRHPLIFQHNPDLKLDEGTTGTTLIDANDSTFANIIETRARVDDYYNGWTITKAGVDLITNGGFEITAGAGTFDDWTDTDPGAGTIAIETTIKFAGSNSAKLSTVTGDVVNIQTINIAVTTDVQHTLTFQFQVSTTDFVQARYQIKNISGGGDLIAPTNADPGGGGAFQKQKVTFTTTSCTSLAIVLHSPTANGDAFYDAATLKVDDSVTGITVTDFESTPFSDWGKVKYTTSGSLSPSVGDNVKLFDATRNLDIDSVRVFQSANRSIITIGSSSPYPKQFPLLFGFIKEFSYFVFDTRNDPGFFLFPANLDAPDDDIFSTGIRSGDLGADGTFNYFIRLAFLYEGGQIGPLTSIEKAITTSQSPGTTSDININLNIGFNQGSSGRFSRILDRRIKAIRIYSARNEESFDLTDVYSFIEEVQIRGDALNRKTSSDDGDDEWSGTDPYTRTIRFTLTKFKNQGLSYELDAGNDVDGSRLTQQVNYRYRIDMSTRSVVGNINLDQIELANLGFSTITGNGDSAIDVFPPLNVISLSKHGATSINGLIPLLDRIIVLDENVVMRLSVSNVVAFSFAVEDKQVGRGAGAERTIEEVLGFVFYYSPFIGVCAYDGNNVIVISDLEHSSIQRTLDTITTTSFHTNAKGWYYPKMRQYWFHIQTGSSTFRTFVYQMFEGRSPLLGIWIEFVFPFELLGSIFDKEGNLFVANSSKIFKADSTSTTDDNTAIKPEWKSKLFNPVTEREADFQEMVIYYLSNTAIDVNFFLDGSGTEETLGNESFPANTTLAKEFNRLPVGTVGEYAQLEVKIPTANQATNTSLDVDSFSLVAEETENIR